MDVLVEPCVLRADVEEVGSKRRDALLIVGENDATVVQLNRRAMALLSGHTRLEIVPGASHLFEEPGALEMVARLAREWFVAHLTQPSESQPASARH
ncbi:hypothetical protein ACFPJ1_21105 [Kribbella qitaiheensis]